MKWSGVSALMPSILAKTQATKQLEFRKMQVKLGEIWHQDHTAQKTISK